MDNKPEDLVSQLVDGLDAGAMVTKYVVIAEGIDTNGERAIYLSTNETAMAHDVLGLLEYSIQLERAAMLKRALREDS
jgi:hypothetical protein